MSQKIVPLEKVVAGLIHYRMTVVLLKRITSCFPLGYYDFNE